MKHFSGTKRIDIHLGTAGKTKEWKPQAKQLSKSRMRINTIVKERAKNRDEQQNLSPHLGPPHRIIMTFDPGSKFQVPW